MTKAADLFDDAWYWTTRHAPEVIGLSLLIMFVGFLLLMFSASENYRAQQIDLCVRAFEYTREQCEFIVRNKVMVRP